MLGERILQEQVQELFTSNGHYQRSYSAVPVYSSSIPFEYDMLRKYVLQQQLLVQQ